MWNSIGSCALSFNYSYGKDTGFNTGKRAAPHCGVMYNSNAYLLHYSFPDDVLINADIQTPKS